MKQIGIYIPNSLKKLLNLIRTQKSQLAQSTININIVYCSIIQFLIPQNAISLSLACKGFTQLHNDYFHRTSLILVAELDNKINELIQIGTEKSQLALKNESGLIRKTLFQVMLLGGGMFLFQYSMFNLIKSLEPSTHTDFFINITSPPFYCQNSRISPILIKILLMGTVVVVAALANIRLPNYIKSRFSDKIRENYSKKSKIISQIQEKYQIYNQRFFEQARQESKNTSPRNCSPGFDEF